MEKLPHIQINSKDCCFISKENTMNFYKKYIFEFMLFFRRKVFLQIYGSFLGLTAKTRKYQNQTVTRNCMFSKPFSYYIQADQTYFFKQLFILT